MYEDVLAQLRTTMDSTVRESRERVDLALDKAKQAEQQAKEGAKAIGQRWAQRINAMRRRAAERPGGGGHRLSQDDVMTFGQDDGEEQRDGDELVSLVEPPGTGQPEATLLAVDQPEPDEQPPAVRPAPRRVVRAVDDDDYSEQSWLE